MITDRDTMRTSFVLDADRQINERFMIFRWFKLVRDLYLSGSIFGSLYSERQTKMNPRDMRMTIDAAFLARFFEFDVDELFALS